MGRLYAPRPLSAGILLTYKCTNECQHCMYACSPKWRDDWIDLKAAEKILEVLSKVFREYYPEGFNQVGVNIGLHFTGGEPFLNFDLLLSLVEAASSHNIPSVFVETNCFWCVNDDITEEKLVKLKKSGLDGILISANPFVVEQIPFERIERAAKISRRIFGRNTIIYQEIFFQQIKSINLKGTLPFKEYLSIMRERDPLGLYSGLSYPSMLLMGRLPYRLGYLYRRKAAKDFFNESCFEELTRNWHVHIDNYYNYITGYCAGISLGDARDLETLCQDGIDLDKYPIVSRLTSFEGIKKLFTYASKEYGYEERKDGYVSKCHLCLDIRRHIMSRANDLKDLRPREFYERL
ncbi:MAG: 4Fe-4S cluster-binding domain-containing protein [Candidatus Bathyarchaeota archaeon]|nr:4Fe-4S cluster-binding domain-containing protein [Candidatus Bathyarchaeota archaeon]